MLNHTHMPDTWTISDLPVIRSEAELEHDKLMSTESESRPVPLPAYDLNLEFPPTVAIWPLLGDCSGHLHTEPLVYREQLPNSCDKFFPG